MENPPQSFFAPIRVEVLNLLRDARSRGSSSAAVAQQLGISKQLANYHLLHLAKDGLARREVIQKIEQHRAYIKFIITPEGQNRLDAVLSRLAGGLREEDKQADIIDLDFQNIQTLFRQFADAVKVHLAPSQWEYVTFLRGAIIAEIDKLRHVMKLRLAGKKGTNRKE